MQFCVGNNGSGIAPERAPNVLERFYRARGDEQTSGHGLGLSIPRELARTFKKKRGRLIVPASLIEVEGN